MNILIKGMEMPKEGFVEILIRDDGTVQQTGQSYRIDGTDYYTPYVGEMPVMYEAVPVPPHGRLIDKRALVRELHNTTFFDGDDRMVVYKVIDAIPTVIEASGGVET